MNNILIRWISNEKQKYFIPYKRGNTSGFYNMSIYMVNKYIEKAFDNVITYMKNSDTQITYKYIKKYLEQEIKNELNKIGYIYKEKDYELEGD